MHSGGCPNQNVLEDYALGRLADETIEAVGRHIEFCPQCQAQVAKFDDVSEELVDRLVGSSLESPFAGEAERERALAMALAVMEIPPASSAAPDAQSDGGRGTGSRLGEYELLEPIGRGGMGTVYRARHTQMHRTVAIKLLPRWCQADKRAIERFQREIKLVAQLDHPNVVRAFDAGETGGERFLVMEYVTGLDLSELVRRCGPPPLADACELVRQAAVALQYVHEHGLIHRDVKPSNLMLAVLGQVKLLDLGLAFVTGHGDELTDPGQMMGTLDYMAPEQASSSHDVDARVDVYGLGATLYTLLCGAAPLASSQQDTPAKKLTALTHGRIPSIRRRRPDIPRSLAAVVHRALSKRPEQRYGTPRELARALEPFCAGCNLATLQQQATRPAACVPWAEQSLVSTSRLVSGASVGTSPASSPRFPRSSLPIRRRINKRVLACVGTAAILILAGVTIVIRRGGQETTVRVPDNSKVNIDLGTDDQVRIDLAQNGAAGGAVPLPMKTAPAGWCRTRCDVSRSSYYPRPTSSLTSHQLEATRWSPPRLLGRAECILAGDLTGDGYFEVVLRDAETLVAFDRWARESWRRDPVVDSAIHLPAGRIGWSSKPELADFDNDGALEVLMLVGSLLPDGWSTKAAQTAIIYDGDGSVLRRFPILDGCGALPKGSVDFNADGYRDIVITTGAYRHPHAVCIYDSVTGQLLCRVDIADAPEVLGIQDIDDDGQLDLFLLQSFASHVDPPVNDYDSDHCYAMRYDRRGNRLWKQVYDYAVDGCLTDMHGNGASDLVLIKDTASGG
jgi:serine/threonine protein kinase